MILFGFFIIYKLINRIINQILHYFNLCQAIQDTNLILFLKEYKENMKHFEYKNNNNYSIFQKR